MPASRKARAMILAPRSWPSSPGFAISTRIFFWVIFCIISPYHCASGFAKQGPLVCQAVAAARLSELEISVPPWFDPFDKHDVLAILLANNLQEIVSRQGPESKVALAVRDLLACRGLADFIQDFFDSEAVFGIREIIVSRQSRANRVICTFGGENASVCVLFLLILLLQISESGR